jgi:thioredoxin 1
MKVILRNSLTVALTLGLLMLTACGRDDASGKSETAAAAVTLPKLIDLGADKCIPCQQMKPILDDLTANHSETFVTEFIDVWQNREEGQKYGIKMIPTQIFFDAEGRELFRHEGFMSKEDILAKWKEFGVE